MNDTQQERTQEGFKDYLKEVKPYLNGMQMSQEFIEIMANGYVFGMTPEESVKRFCENKNKEIQKDILELTKQ